VDRRVLFFREYPYRTGVTEALVVAFDEGAARAIDLLGLKEGDLVVDVGSNDGTLLHGFKRRGMGVVGVEPTGVASIAVESGVPTINDFFGADVADRIVREHGQAALVTATNVFAHVSNLDEFIGSIHRLLKSDGVFLSESHYVIDLMDTLQYDTIYHEHLRYYSLTALVDVMARRDFSVVDAEKIPNHGGSIRVYSRKGLDHPQSSSVQQILHEEKSMALDGAFDRFRERVQRSKWDLMRLLTKLKAEGCSIAGVGAPGRASTVLNYCGIGTDYLDYLAELPGSLKIGLRSPGTHVPIIDESRMLADQPDCALLLAWHLGDGIRAKLRDRGLKSRIIVPLPEVRVYEN
jgi:SAM-dependent methyltransferase